MSTSRARSRPTHSDRLHVSIIIPSYNAAATIADTLRSVRDQVSTAWEAIVVDDGSTDATAEIARRFATQDPRIIVIAQANGGEAAARNAGIDRARYDWLLFLDADDWISPRHLVRLTGELLSNPDLDAVHCGSVRVASDGREVKDQYEAPAGDLFPTLARRAAFPVHACIVRRSLVDAVGRFDTSLRKSADWDLWQRIARTGARFGAVREVLAYYRMQPRSASLEARQLLEDGLTVLRRGHAADPRVTNASPLYGEGLPSGETHCQQFYLLCWCAGLTIGNGEPATSLLELMADSECRDLYPDAVGQCLFESATLPQCKPPDGWETLWPSVHGLVETFLEALEERIGAFGLKDRALHDLKTRILRSSPMWGPIVLEAEDRAAAFQREQGSLQAALDDAQRRAADSLEQAQRFQHQHQVVEQERQTLEQQHQVLEQERQVLEERRQALEQRLQALERQRNTLEQQLRDWQGRAGDLAEAKSSLTEHLTEANREIQRYRQRLEDLQARPWVRLGTRLRLLSGSPASAGHD